MSSEARDNCQPYRLGSRGFDLAPIADLWIASWQATLAGIDFSVRRAWFLTYVVEIERRGGLMLCAFDQEGILSGFILLDTATAILEQIAIAPRFFGSGLGAFLLGAAKDRCRTGLSLDVNTDNPRAVRFYEKHGFLRVGPGTNPHSGLAIWHMRWPGG